MSINSVIFHQTGSDDLSAEIANKVYERLTVLFTPSPPVELTNKLYTRQETAEYIGISLPTLNAWTKQGIIQAVRIGSRVRYRYADIEAALQVVKSVKYQRSK